MRLFMYIFLFATSLKSLLTCLEDYGELREDILPLYYKEFTEKTFLQHVKDNVKKFFFGARSVNGNYNVKEKNEDHKKKTIISNMKDKFLGLFRKNKRSVMPVSVAVVEMRRQMPKTLVRGWIYAELGAIPPRAFVAGVNEEQKRYYVARAIPSGKAVYYAGILVEGAACVRLALNEFSHCYRRYQVLTGEGYKWVETYKKNFHPDAVFSDDYLSFYVCRKATPENVVSIGYADREGVCTFGARGLQYSNERYDLLADVWSDPKI